MEETSMLMERKLPQLSTWPIPPTYRSSYVSWGWLINILQEPCRVDTVPLTTPEQGAHLAIGPCTRPTRPTVPAKYDPEASGRTSADSSSQGAVLMQSSGEESTWKPVPYVSRAMMETERHCAQIVKGALTTTWACDKFASYILLKKVHVETDLQYTTTKYKAPQQHSSKSFKILPSTGNEWLYRFTCPRGNSCTQWSCITAASFSLGLLELE